MSAEEIVIVVLMFALVVVAYRIIRRAVRLGTRDALRELRTTTPRSDGE